MKNTFQHIIELFLAFLLAVGLPGDPNFVDVNSNTVAFFVGRLRFVPLVRR